MWPLIKKDIKIHLESPVFAVVAALFLFLTGFAFTAQMTQASPQHLPEASLRGILYFMAVILLFVSPFLTMRSIAEERKAGTMELLKTLPLSDLRLVLGKFLAVWILHALLLISTLEFPLLLLLIGEPEVGTMLLSYLGLLLLGGAFLSVGLFCSSLTRSQMVAAILTFVFLITLWFLSDIGGTIGETVSVITHLESFGTGVFDLSDFLYYLLFIFGFLFLTVRWMEAERWK